MNTVTDTSKYAYLTLLDITDEFMIGSFNDRRKYFLNYYNHAKWVYLDLVKEILQDHHFRSVVVPVNNQTDPASLVLPSDCDVFISAGVQNQQGEHRNFIYKNDMGIPIEHVFPTTQICKKCGSRDELADQVAKVQVITEEVTIDGQPYNVLTYTKLLDDGKMVRIVRRPYKNFYDGNSSSYIITYQETQTVLCQLEKKECGCLVQSETNIGMVLNFCGCFIPSRPRQHSSEQALFAGYGYVRKDGRTLYLQGQVPDNVIITYKSNGMCDPGRALVPWYAMNAMLLGITWRAAALSVTVNRLGVREAKGQFESAKQDLLEYLTVFSVSEFLDLQGRFPLWGAPAHPHNYHHA